MTGGRVLQYMYMRGALRCFDFTLLMMAALVLYRRSFGGQGFRKKKACGIDRKDLCKTCCLPALTLHLAGAISRSAPIYESYWNL